MAKRKVIIVGAGQLGYFLAKNLLESNQYKVKIIESDPERCKMAARLDGIQLCHGDGTRLETLEKANAGKCDVFIAVTGKDEDNLVACEIAKSQFKVKRTLSKSNNQKNISLMKKLGIDTVLDTTGIITELIGYELDSAQVQLIADIGAGNAVISEYSVPMTWKQSGRKVSELDIPAECVLVYLKRSGVFMIPRGNTVLMGGDTIVALTVGAAAKQLRRLFEL